MAKFTVTRKRMVQQEATVTITVKDGEMPMDKAAKLADSKWKWTNTSESELSADVAPVVEEVAVDG